MDKKIMAFALAAVAMTGVSACSSNTGSRSALDRPPGEYETESSTVDRYGTRTTTKKTTDVEVDKYGNKKATIETESSHDPKGLFNKSTTESKEVIREGY